MWVNEWANNLVSIASVVGTIPMDKWDFIMTIYEHMLIDDIWKDETAGEWMREFGNKNVVSAD